MDHKPMSKSPITQRGEICTLPCAPHVALFKCREKHFSERCEKWILSKKYIKRGIKKSKGMG